jgi:pimeloyl-ACP methyl ester carboxylesterase
VASARCARAQVIVLGKSLGGAVALHVAAANPGRVAAVVVENTFLSIEDVAPKVGHGRLSQTCIACCCLPWIQRGHRCH